MRCRPNWNCARPWIILLRTRGAPAPRCLARSEIAYVYCLTQNASTTPGYAVLEGPMTKLRGPRGRLERRPSPLVRRDEISIPSSRLALLSPPTTSEALSHLLGRDLVVPGVNVLLLGWALADTKSVEVELDPIYVSPEIHCLIPFFDSPSKAFGNVARGLEVASIRSRCPSTGPPPRPQRCADIRAADP